MKKRWLIYCFIICMMVLCLQGCILIDLPLGVLEFIWDIISGIVGGIWHFITWIIGIILGTITGIIGGIWGAIIWALDLVCYPFAWGIEKICPVVNLVTEPFAKLIGKVPVIGWIYAVPDKIDSWNYAILGTHRGMLSHSALPVFAFTGTVGVLSKKLAKLIFIIVGGLIGFHLFLDLFPEGFGGTYTFIHLPIINTTITGTLGNFAIVFNEIWLAGNIFLIILIGKMATDEEDG